MPKFEVEETFHGTAFYEVEAETRYEAVKKVKSGLVEDKSRETISDFFASEMEPDECFEYAAEDHHHDG